MILLFIPCDVTTSFQCLGGLFTELHSVILNVDVVISCVGPEPVRVVQCQSSCGPTAEMALREHLREAEREGLGEESTRIDHGGAQNKIFGHAC